MSPEVLQHAAGNYICAFLQSKRSKVLTDHCNCRLAPLNENGARSAAAQRLNPHSPGAGVSIQEHGVFDLRSEYAEQRFANPVRCRTSIQTFQTFKSAAPKLARNHPHTQPTSTRP